MEQLWAPWRMNYIKLAQKSRGDCFLCQLPKEDNDESNLILHRGKLNFIILNSFPYNAGHLMVAPYRQTGSLEELTDDELREHFELVRLATSVLKKALKADGFNIGINMGRVAGAGVSSHIHTHIVPRWWGDANFMPVIGDTKVVNEALSDTYRKLKNEL
jgi:ATP adenylyltransferase